METVLLSAGALLACLSLPGFLLLLSETTGVGSVSHEEFERDHPWSDQD